MTGWVNRVNPVHLAKLVFAPTSVNSAHIHQNHQNHQHGWCVFKTVITLGLKSVGIKMSKDKKYKYKDKNHITQLEK